MNAVIMSSGTAVAAMAFDPWDRFTSDLVDRFADSFRKKSVSSQEIATKLSLLYAGLGLPNEGQPIQLSAQRR